MPIMCTGNGIINRFIIRQVQVVSLFYCVAQKAPLSRAEAPSKPILEVELAGKKAISFIPATSTSKRKCAFVVTRTQVRCMAAKHCGARKCWFDHCALLLEL